MAGTDALAQGRQDFARGSWRQAHARLRSANEEAALAPEDLEQLGVASYLAGNPADGDDALANAHFARLERGDAEQAVRCAFWLGLSLMERGETARGGGWLSRAQHVLESCPAGCVEEGLLMVPAGLQLLEAGATDQAYDTFRSAAELGERHQDPDLTALGRLGQGQARVLAGDHRGGTRLLDEAMVAVTSSRVSPIVTGIVYCALIETCTLASDLGRAREWTSVLSRWCEAQPDLVPFQGQCLVYRSEIMRHGGTWDAALAEAQRATRWLSEPAEHPALGSAYYQLGELYRLQGQFDLAESAYGQAGDRSKSPDPGLPLLRLARGDVQGAVAAIRRALAERDDSVSRSRLLPARVEIELADGQVAAAQQAASDLADVAASLDIPLVRATSLRANGMVLLAQGDPQAALRQLRPACSLYREIDTPYETARTRLLIAAACEELGDVQSAETEREAARRTLAELGAAPGVAETLLAPAGLRTVAANLTAREQEVLALVAKGKTNREIAAALVISEKTVARHVSNLFDKLDVSSRSAATAYAYEHSLV